MIAADPSHRFGLAISERNRVAVIVGLVSFFLAVGLLGYWVLRNDDAVAETRPVQERRSESFETRSVVSAKGGYELKAPRAWRVSKTGRATSLSSPRGDMVVTVGPAPRGNLSDSANEIFNSVAETYSRVSFTGAARQQVDGREAVVFGGKGTNVQGIRLRFVGVSFTDGGRNHAMTAFVQNDSDARRVLPRIERIINTFTAE